MTIFHKCKCGCRIPRQNMIKNKNNILICPTHRQTTLSRYVECEICGEKKPLAGLLGGSQSMLCEKHQAEKNKITKKKYADKHPPEETNKGKGAKCRKNDNKIDLKRRRNCVHAMTICWKKHEFMDSLPCKTCKRFKQEDFRTDVYNTRNNYSERERHGLFEYA